MKSLRLLLPVVLAAVLCGAGRGAEAAVAEFFWSGFNLSDPGIDKARIEKVLYENSDLQFRSRNKGAIRPLLERLQWDEFTYYETASETGYVKENMRDVYGVFLSIDRVMQFRPSTAEIAGQRKEKYYTYVFVTLNVFAADSRNLVFSHPVFLTDVQEQRPDLSRGPDHDPGQVRGRAERPGKSPTPSTIQRPPSGLLRPSRRVATRPSVVPANPIQTIDDYFRQHLRRDGSCAARIACGVMPIKSGMVQARSA